jgi:hypothetical protein
MSLMSPRIAGCPSNVIGTFTISAGMTVPDFDTKRTSIAGPAAPVLASCPRRSMTNPFESGCTKSMIRCPISEVASAPSLSAANGLR